MNSACINWRGLQHKLVTPQWYCNGSKNDFIEVINHLIESLKPSKVFLLGISLGGSVLANALAEIKVDGAVIMNAPINKTITMQHIKNGFGGYLNYAFGAEFLKLLLPHQHNEEIVEAFKKEHDLDLLKLIADLKKSPDTFHFHEKMITQTFGYDSNKHYFASTSCHQVIKDIKTPTLFMHSLDDPIIPTSAVDFEAINSNPNTLIGVTEMGGHTSYHTSVRDTSSQWFIPIALDFLQAL